MERARWKGQGGKGEAERARREGHGRKGEKEWGRWNGGVRYSKRLSDNREIRGKYLMNCF